MDIEITINGRKVMAKSGSTILEAASRNGVRIPTLCHLGRLKPIGSCRICVVEVSGLKNPLPACVAKIKEGYDIQTETEKVWNIRKEVLSHLLLEHPLDCPVCDKSGECMLQDLSFEFDMTVQQNTRVFPDRTKIFKSNLIEYMSTRCVLCSRCIRVCTEMYGNPFYQIKDKGFNGYIGLKDDDKVMSGVEPGENCSFQEIKTDVNYLNCYYCGNCVEVCPVGALISKPSKFKERYWQETPFASICDKCSAGCKIEYYRYDLEESLVRTAALFGGYLCNKGFFYEGIGKGDEYYIQNPMIRLKSVVQEVDLNRAVQEFANRIKKISENGSMQNTAVLVSPSISSNDGFLISSFVSNILKSGYFDIAESSLYRKNFNRFAQAFKSEESFNIKTLQNSDVILYIGSIEDEIPFASYNIMKAHREHGAKVILGNIVRQSKNALSRFEDIAFIKNDIDINGLHGFLVDLRRRVYDCKPKKEGAAIVQDVVEPTKVVSIAAEIDKSSSISIIIGDYTMSTCDIGKDMMIIKEIVDFLRDEQKIVSVYSLIKPTNYRGLLNVGFNSCDSNNFNDILSELDNRTIKNLIFFGDFFNEFPTNELVKHAAGLEFVGVFASKTSILSAMADVVIPIPDFLEGKNILFENFEGKKIVLNNEFHFGNNRLDMNNILKAISVEIGHSFDYAKNNLDKFIAELNPREVAHYNKINKKTHFYYNNKNKPVY